MRQPNLLFVFADQMREMAMGCAGNPHVHTPTIDRLAAEGVRLTDCIATTPVCGPSRATLLTGTYPTTHRVLGNDLPVRTDLPALGTLARSHGYRTGYIGKWHLDGVPRDKYTPPGPRRLGFDDWAVFNCSHQYFDAKYYHDSPTLIREPGYEPVVQTNLALRYLEMYSRGDRPFCLALSWGPPHDPYDQVPQAYREQYTPESLELRPNVQPTAENPLARGKDCRRTTADYYAAVTALDDQLGRLLDKLDELGMAEETVVVFTSDHGDMLWSHGWMKKQLPHEESIRVPMLVRWPGHLPAGETSGVLMGLVDLLPTLAGLLGWEVPGQIEGRDLAGSLRQPDPADATVASVLIANYSVADEGARQRVPVWRGVRTRRFTYVETLGRVPWLLFDNERDCYQLTNQVDNPVWKDEHARLRQMLDDWLERTADPVLDTPAMMSHYEVEALWLEREQNKHGASRPTEPREREG